MHVLYFIAFCSAVTTITAIPTRVGKDIEIPAGGPCLFNNDKLKCSDNGFYEMVQCDAKSCFCVDSHNGQIAELTRTSNNKIAPKCSDCQISMFEKFKSSTLPDVSHIRKCDNQHGFYESLQCQGNSCYCVDPKTGKEIDGTRQQNELNNRISCKSDREEPPTASSSRTEGIVALPECRLPEMAGYACNDGNPQTMYHFDVETFSCLAFKYNGCGGNKNRFVSASACHTSCLLMDFSACSFLATPATFSNGTVITCGGFSAPSSDNNGCPNDFQCMMGAFFGYCCPNASEEKMRKARNPQCADKRKPEFTNTQGYDSIVFGRKCSNNFCSNGYKCVEGDVFAYCCPR